MQTTEVTQRQWKAVMGNNPSGFKDCGEDCPVETLSWEDANTFIERLNQEDPAKRYSLPTEAQWEYAARADTKTPFSFGSCLTTQQANYNGKNPFPGCPKGEYRQKTTPVKSFKPNKWGLYDMHGNVYEWCQDWYKKDFSPGVNDPEGPAKGADRVLRGGTWHCDPRNVRSSSRSWDNPTSRYRDDPDGRSYYFGLRLVLRPAQ